jgi:nucleoside phosphorylase
MIDGRVFRIGTLAGVPVVLGMTGIGLVNAATTTAELLDRFAVAGVIVSAVAGGSTQQIGDVAVPEAFELKDGTTFAADPKWLALVREIAASGSVTLERCTVVANPPPTTPVCMLQQPEIVVGGVGLSSDSNGGKPFACIPGGNDFDGCDVPSSAATSALPHERRAFATVATADTGTPVIQDMETAAIAREAAARGLPFIGFRAISDGGTGDPLGLSGFLPEFAAYYRFAAHNAALATVAFLERLAAARN